METSTQVRSGPEMTPALIRQLIFLTVGISLFAALSEPLMQALFHLPGLSYLLALSKQGLQNYYIWQVFTFLFLEDTQGQGPSFTFIIRLVFNMYLLWIMGSDVLERVGQASFLRLYFFSGILVGLATLWVMNMTGHYGTIAGSGPAVLAIVSAWTLFNPEATLLLFFIYPIKAKWIFALIAGSYLLVYLAHLNWILLTFTVLPLLIGYIYAMIAWDLPGLWNSPVDSFLRRIGRFFRSLGQKVTLRKEKGKIVDFKTGETRLNDNDFVDKMLEKISKHGESSLSWSERQRLQAISKEKRKK